MADTWDGPINYSHLQDIVRSCPISFDPDWFMKKNLLCVQIISALSLGSVTIQCSSFAGKQFVRASCLEKFCSLFINMPFLEQLQNTRPLTPCLNLLLLRYAVRSPSRWIRDELSVKLKCYRGPQSGSGWIRDELSIELKCYRGPQSRSRWIRDELSVKLKCYRGPQSRSRWIRDELSVKLNCYRGPQSGNRWIRDELSVELKCYRGPQSRSWWICNELSVELKCYRGP